MVARFSLAVILVLAGGAILLAVPFCTRISARLNRAGKASVKRARVLCSALLHHLRVHVSVRVCVYLCACVCARVRVSALAGGEAALAAQRRRGGEEDQARRARGACASYDA